MIGSELVVTHPQIMPVVSLGLFPCLRCEKNQHINWFEIYAINSRPVGASIAGPTFQNFSGS